ncbi:MAG: NAD-dependent epimerase/dehydratase family protein, partial [Candidatus Aminicenantaceae bacterium]
MICFLTGATGYVGSALAEKLVRDGHTVHALYRSFSKARPLQHPRIRWFHGDLLDPSRLEEAMRGCLCAFHTGAQTGLWSKKPDSFREVNVQETKNVMECAVRAGIHKVVV